MDDGPNQEAKEPAVIIKPTIGRKVWYRPHESDAMVNSQHGMLDATIVEVWDDRLVNLVVFDANGFHYTKTSVQLVQEGDNASVYGGYAEWMPYQTGQAAKTEALEKEAAA